VIQEVDKALKILVGSSAGAPEGLEIVFDPPSRKWVENMPTTPTINFCLYDVKEDMKQRQVGQTPVRNERNRIIGFRPPPTIYKLSYIATAWSGTEDIEEDHQLLGWLLYVLAGLKQMPPSTLTGSLARWGSAGLQIGQPSAEGKPTPQSLSALGGDVRATLEVVVSAPFAPEPTEAAGLVLEELILEAEGKSGQPFERVQRRMTEGIAELERGLPGDPIVEKSRAPENPGLPPGAD
jgi:hypothetical protein